MFDWDIVRGTGWRWLPCSLLAAVFIASGLSLRAEAVEIVLDGGAPYRIERQRAAATGQLPLAKTPDLSKFQARLKAGGHKLGDHVFIRVFKEESELEVWLRRGGTFVKFATYPICFWSGDLGPKLREGDKQTPEGIYTIGSRQLRLIGRHPKSLNLWFPNAYDKANERTGSYILVHGGCSSIGCYAITDAVLDEVHKLVSRAIRRGGQRLMHLHAFPFRMTDENMVRYAGHRWHDFWSDLKVAYDLFEETRLPPQVGVCNRRYVFAKAKAEKTRLMPIRKLVAKDPSDPGNADAQKGEKTGIEDTAAADAYNAKLAGGESDENAGDQLQCFTPERPEIGAPSSGPYPREARAAAEPGRAAAIR